MSCELGKFLDFDVVTFFQDFEEFPEHRTNFFLLLQAVNLYCFESFLSIPATQFKLVLDSIIWAFKHTMRNVADTGLNILNQLLQNVSGAGPEAAQSFYKVRPGSSICVQKDL